VRISIGVPSECDVVGGEGRQKVAGLRAETLPPESEA
jgi:hypothetical protein